MIGTYETKPMSIRHEIKSQLAKLLATEDLVVEHKKVQTACFNVHTRVLTLPLWEKASNTVYDLLVGHEVGHALFTPDEDWLDKVKVPPQFVNVVEDARIEKLMKRKYAGLAKTFYNGYKELNEDDFFQIEEEDISTFNLADRANLFFKIGNYSSIPIEDGEESEIINLIAASETFADALIAAEELYKYCKKEKEQEQKVADFDSHEMSGGSQSPANDIVDTNDSSSEQEGESNNSQPQEDEGSYGGTAQGDQTQVNSSEDGEPEVRTADSLEEKIRDLVGNAPYENTYVEIPKLNLDTVIAKNSEVHTEIDTSFEHQQKLHNNHAKDHGYDSMNLYQESDAEFKKFKTSAQKEVNYLVKEFECRKQQISMLVHQLLALVF